MSIPAEQLAPSTMRPDRRIDAPLNKAIRQMVLAGNLLSLAKAECPQTLGDAQRAWDLAVEKIRTVMLTGKALDSGR